MNLQQNWNKKAYGNNDFSSTHLHKLGLTLPYLCADMYLFALFRHGIKHPYLHHLFVSICFWQVATSFYWAQGFEKTLALDAINHNSNELALSLSGLFFM